MNNLWQDVRYAIRMLLKKPAFTLIAVTALALGIGANSALFSVVNAVLLRPLPYKEPGQIVKVRDKLEALGMQAASVSVPEFVDYRDLNQSFEQVAAYTWQNYNLTGTGEPERVAGANVSADLFAVLGVPPRLGRAFTIEEEKIGSHRAVILSDKFWKRRFNSDQNAIGQTLAIDGESFTVVGVMPDRFWFPSPDAELWTPLALNEGLFTEKERGSRFLDVIARLRPGVTLEQAQAEMNAVAARLRELYPGDYTEALGFGISVVPRREELVGRIRPTLLILLGAVGFVLLIACANVANLLLARAAARQKEIAIRMALGASRWRVIRQLLAESLLLSFIGGAAGLLLALWGVDVLVSLIPRGEVPRIEEIGVDLTVLGFTFAVSIMTGLLFGLAPALQTSRPNLNEALKEGGRTSTGASSRSLHNMLIIAEVAMTLVLLVGAGLLIKSFLNLSKVNPGFNADNVLTMRVTLPASKYPERTDQSSFFRQVLERTQSLPGVEAAGAVTALPLSGWSNDWSFSIEGRAGMDGLPNQVLPAANYVAVSPDYFRAMGISLLKGRAFTDAATDESSGVIINEAMARQYFADEEPIGKRIKMGSQQSPYPWTEIVGVTADVKHSRLDNETKPEMYFSYANLRKPRMGAMFLVARAKGDPLAIAGEVRGQILAIDRDQPASNVSAMGQLLSDSIAQRRFNMLLLGLLAALALVMAAVGLYGIIAYSVTERTHEIGVRMALGATSRDVFKLIIGQGMTLAVIGIALGLAGAFAITRIISSWLSGMLFEVNTTDAVTFTLIPAALMIVALAASYIPARRATRIDPMEALRYE